MKKRFSIPMTRPQFNQARYRLVTQHLVTPEFDEDHGKMRARGVDLDYSYDGAALNITIEHKPALFPEGAVEAKIRDWFRQA
jgi:hypothetical protein